MNALIKTVAMLVCTPAAWCASELELQAKRVVVFKNGYALVIKEGKAIADERGEVHTTQVPETAVLGTVWVTSDGEPVSHVRATTATVEGMSHYAGDATTIAEVLAANVGKAVELTTYDVQEATVRGRVIDVMNTWPDARVEEPLAVFEAAAVSSRFSGDPLVAVEVEDGQVTVMPVSQVRRVSGSGLRTTYEIDTPTSQSEKRLDIGVGKPGQETTVRMIYFTPGVRWIPTYRLDGVSRPEGRLWLQGEVLNELEDFENVPVSLVVGVPSFRFQDVVSPLALEGVLRNALLEAAPQLMGQGQMLQAQYSNAYQARSREVVMPETTVPAGLPEAGDEGVGAGGQDLYVYDVGEMTLKRGDRAAFRLWDEETPINHVYTFDIAVQRQQSGSCTVYDRKGGSFQLEQSLGSPLRLSTNRVWHQLELRNNGSGPWTTGPLLAFDEHIPIAQDLLTYTSPGATTLVPLTVATDIRASYEEEEISREPNVLNWGGHAYSRITKKCKVTLTSLKRSESSLRVGIALGGKARAVSHEGSLVVTDMHADDWDNNHSWHVNNHSDLKWSLSLASGQTVELTFEVEYFVY